MLWHIIEIIGAVHGDIQTNIGDYWVNFATENWFVLLAGDVCGDIPGTHCRQCGPACVNVADHIITSRIIWHS